MLTTSRKSAVEITKSVSLPRLLRRRTVLERHRIFRPSAVRDVEELHEENQVAEVHERSEEDVLEGLPTVGGPAGFRLDRHHGDLDRHSGDHLDDLQRRYRHVDEPRRPEAGGADGVVRVHDGVDGVVDGHEPPSGGEELAIAVERVDHDGNVVEPVEEHERLLSNDDERRIAEFDDLRRAESEAPEPGRAVVDVLIADGVAPAVSDDAGDELAAEVVGAADAERRKRRVPEEERRSKAQRRSVLHEAPTGEDARDVEKRNQKRLRLRLVGPRATGVDVEGLLGVECVEEHRDVEY